MQNSKLKFAVSTVISVFAALAIFLVVLMIAQKNHHTFDLTKNKRFTLSPQSVQTVKELPHKVEALVFLLLDDIDGRQKAEELLNQYQQADPAKFSYKIVDPKLDPMQAKKYEVRMPGCVVFVGDNKRTSRAMSFEETQMTNALLNLSDLADKKVYFLQGHGEISAYETRTEQNMKGLPNMSQFRADMATEGFTALDLNLGATKKIPEDAAVVVIPGPKTELLPAEAKLIEDWIAQGGRVLLTLEMETLNKYDAFLSKYGFQCPDELVIDEMAQLFGAEPVYSIALQYNQECSAVKDFNMQTLYRLARPVDVADKAPTGAKVIPLMLTGPNAMTLKLSSVMESKEVQVGEKDVVRRGSMPLAAAGTYPVADSAQAKDPKAAQDGQDGKDSEAPTKTKEGRVVVIGDSEFFCNDMYKAAGNRDLILNILNWLGENENRITIRAKDENSQPLILEDNVALRIKAFLIFALPLSVLILGFVNVRSRRRQV